MADPKDFSKTAASNTTVGGVSIDEGALTANMNNSQREILATLAPPADFGDTAGAIAVDDIAESTADAGVTVDGLLIKDGAVPSLANSIQTDQPAETTRDIGPDQTALSDTATIEWNLEENPSTRVLLSASRTMGTPTNIRDGHTYILVIEQGGTGSYTMTWPGVFRWGNLGEPVLPTAVGSKAVITCLGDEGTLLAAWQAGF